MTMLDAKGADDEIGRACVSLCQAHAVSGSSRAAATAMLRRPSMRDSRQSAASRSATVPRVCSLSRALQALRATRCHRQTTIRSARSSQPFHLGVSIVHGMGSIQTELSTTIIRTRSSGVPSARANRPSRIVVKIAVPADTAESFQRLALTVCIADKSAASPPRRGRLVVSRCLMASASNSSSRSIWSACSAHVYDWQVVHIRSGRRLQLPLARSANSPAATDSRDTVSSPSVSSATA